MPSVWQLPEFLFLCVVSPQLYFVYWDMSHCLRTLTDTLEEHNCAVNDIQVRGFTLCCLSSHLLIFLTCPQKRWR